MPDAATTQSGPFNPNITLPNLKNTDIDVEKLKNKSAKELAELQGKLQQQLAQQQAQYAQALQQQQAASQMALQQGQQNWQSPFTAAGLTGQYNGQSTLAAQAQAAANGQYAQNMEARGNEFQANLGLQYNQLTNQQNQFNAGQALQAGMFDTQQAFNNRQLDQTGSQFQQSFGLQQQQFGLQDDIEHRQAALADLAQQQQNAIQQGNLDLARQIQTRTLDLQQQQQQAQNQLAQQQQSGYLDNGNLTEAARAARAQESAQNAQIMGVGANGMSTEQAREFAATHTLAETQAMGINAQGQMTDAAQQWRAQAGLQYAQTAAQLQANPGDYFQSAAYMRGAQDTGAPAFLSQLGQQNNQGNMGFRGQQNYLPPTGSMAQLTGGQPQSNMAMQGNPQAMAQGVPLSADGMPQRSVGGFGLQTGPAGDPNAQQTKPVGDNMYGNQMQGLGSSGDIQRMGPGSFGDGGTMQKEGPSGSLSNATAAASGAPASYTTMMNTAPQQPTMSQGMPGMGQQQSGYGDPAQQRLAGFQPAFMQGMQKMAPGSMESMNPTEKSLWGSAARASGLNPDDLDAQYQRSRIHNDASATLA